MNGPDRPDDMPDGVRGEMDEGTPGNADETSVPGSPPETGSRAPDTGGGTEASIWPDSGDVTAKSVRDVFGAGTGMAGSPRTVVLAVVVGVLLLGVLIDVLRPESGTDAGGAGVEAVQRVFHCPDTPTGERVDTEISIASNSSEATEATVEIVSDAPEEPPKSVSVEVPVRGTAIVRLSDHSKTAGAASVILPGGDELAVAAKIVRSGGGVNGVASYPCPDEVAETWSFATGSTTKGVLEFLYVYNPSDEKVVFDVRFKTRNEGETASREETPLGGLTLEPHRRAKVAVHEAVIRRDDVAATVEATRGRVVVSESLLPAGGASGFGSTIGSDSARKRSFFTGGRSVEGQTNLVTVLNETDEIGLATTLAYPETGSEPIPPKDVEFPATSVATLDLSGVVDAGTSVALEIETDVAAVADQLRTAGGDTALVTPLVGPARAWLLPVSPQTPGDAFVELVNPGDREIEASIYLLSAEGARSSQAMGKPVTVPPGTRVGLDTGDLGITQRGGLLVTFDGGGLVGHGLYEQGDWAIMPGIPVR